MCYTTIQKNMFSMQTILCVAGKRTNSISITRKALHIIYLCLDLQIYLVAFYLFPACSSASKSISITPIWRCTCQLYFPSLSFLLRKVHSNFFCFYICLSFCLYHFLYFTNIGVIRPRTRPSKLCGF